MRILPDGIAANFVCPDAESRGFDGVDRGLSI